MIGKKPSGRKFPVAWSVFIDDPRVRTKVCTMNAKLPAQEEMANARLIAAAPELLEALNYLLEQTVDMDLQYGIELTEGEADAGQKALAAIARATGN